MPYVSASPAAPPISTRNTARLTLSFPRFGGHLDVAPVSWTRVAGISCCGLARGVAQFVLDGAHHAECTVSASAVVEDLEVLEDGIGQLGACRPALAVE
jgi:hypothetical protein